ncbi:unnamed protein product, partial [Fusarium fujikuroi]
RPLKQTEENQGLIIAKINIDRFSRKKILINISSKLSRYKKIKPIRKPKLTVCFFIAIIAIIFKGSLKSNFSIAIFIRDKKALEYKKERLNTLI